MTVLPISLYPEPVLKKKAVKIPNPKDPEIRELILDMLETMEENGGVGLAANQVGRSLMLAVIKVDGKTYILVNPVIKSKSWKKIIEEEGCLSFPGLRLPILRHQKVRVKAQNRQGTIYELKAEGLLSRVLQHEIDHLDGIPFTKRKAKIKKSKNNSKIIWKKAL